VRSFKLDNGVRTFVYPRPGELTAVTLSLGVPPGTNVVIRRSIVPILVDAMVIATKGHDASKLTNQKLATSLELTTAALSDQLVVSATFRTDAFEEALELLGEVVREPLLETREVEYRKMLRMNMLSAPADRPDRIAQEVLDELLFGPDHPIGAALGERVDDVRAIRREQVVAAYEALRDPSRLVVAIAGGLDGDLRPMVEREFGSLRAKASAPHPRASASRPAAPASREPVGLRRFALVDRPGANTVRVKIAAAGPDLRGDDDIAALVLQWVVGGRLSALQKDLALTDQLSATFRNDVQGSEFVMATEVPSGRSVDGLRGMAAILDSIRQDGVSDVELEAAKSRIRLQQPGSFERVSTIAWSVARMATLGDDPDERLHTYTDRVQAITAADVKALANRLLASEALRTVVQGDAARIREPLAQAGYATEKIRDAAGTLQP
jgi:predicted Zn-dependent peptidase